MEEFLEKEVGQIMNSRIWDLPVVEENAPIKVVLVVLIGRCYTWVVKNKEMEIAGIITEHDALKLLNEYNENMKAGDIMSRHLTIAHPEEKVKDAMEKMIKKGYRRMPVVNEENKLVGEITLRHLIERLYSLLFQ